jgi:membrane-associated phospholipid phosphatase
MGYKRFGLKVASLFFCFLMIACNLHAERPDSLKNQVYKINLWIDIPLTVVSAATNYWGLVVVDQKSVLDSMTIINLDPNDVNRFDRSATRQNSDFAPTARKLSDYGMAISFMLPLVLLADKEIRRDWAPLALLFLETQAITSNLFSWGAAFHIDRIRPLVYHPEVPYEDKTYVRNKNSFYSGHTSTSASASFFTAKVYCDYHPELGNKKYLVYSLALIPPMYTGFFRYKGMKHFPTDVLTGFAVGAGVGLLIPHLHKRTGPNLTVLPYTGRVNGLALSYKF